jgi:tight adherence protein B
MTPILAVLVFVSVALFGYAVTVGLTARQARRRAFRDRFSAMTGWMAGSLQPSVLKDQRLSRIDVFNALLARLAVTNRLRRMILQAGVGKRVGEFVLYVPLLATLGLLITTVLGAPLVIGLLVAIVAGAVPFILLARMRRKRAAMFAEQLPDALDLMRSALQAGHGVVGCFTLIADEFPEPIAGEFREVAEEVRLGLPMRDALQNLTQRIDNPDTPLLAVGLLVAQDVGGNMAEVLDNISYTIRERFKLLRDVRVLTAQGRLSGMILTVLPFILAGVMMALSPEYMAPVFREPLGHAMIAYVFGSVIVGHFVIRRILNFQV